MYSALLWETPDIGVWPNRGPYQVICNRRKKVRRIPVFPFLKESTDDVFRTHFFSSYSSQFSEPCHNTGERLRIRRFGR